MPNFHLPSMGAIPKSVPVIRSISWAVPNAVTFATTALTVALLMLNIVAEAVLFSKLPLRIRLALAGAAAQTIATAARATKRFMGDSGCAARRGDQEGW